jgi:hypothetical protein
MFILENTGIWRDVKDLNRMPKGGRVFSDWRIVW